MVLTKLSQENGLNWVIASWSSRGQICEVDFLQIALAAAFSGVFA